VSEVRRARRWALILPVLLESKEQHDNLCAVLESAAGAGAHEIWVVEQGEQRLASVPPGVSHRVVPSRRRLLERSRLVNGVLDETSSELVWIHDPDLLLPLAAIGAELGTSTEVAVQPFTAQRRLSRHESERRLAGDGAVGSAPFREVPFGKASFVVEREVLLALGGLSEAFAGQADEGLELARRLKHFFRDIARYVHTGDLLWRPRSTLEKASALDNKLLRQRLALAIDADVESYLVERLDSCLRPQIERLRQLSRAVARATAFRASDPHPPPRFPRALPGEIWGIVALFNPAGYRSKLENYRAFRERLARQGLPLCTVELAFGDAVLELDARDAERLIQLRAPDVLWQKERLLNVALEHLPSGCDKVVWLDADVLFEREDWVAATARALQEQVVVQPFSRSVRLLPGERRIATDDLPVGSGEHEILHGMAWGVAAKGPASLCRYLEHGHSGYAWAARRELIDRHGLYDANVLGNGDLNIAHAMFGGARALKLERLSDPARRHLERWADAFYADVRGSVGWIEGTVFHLWHGKKADRRYLDRLEHLPLAGYDPERDLVKDESGVYRWISEKPTLHAFCREYFERRREDAPSP
jgi:hypothetical protein